MMTPETKDRLVAWLIERKFHGVTHYWTGRPNDHLGVWSTKPDEAMRFARKDDANAMLTWHCEGIGESVEHVWVAQMDETSARAPKIEREPETDCQWLFTGRNGDVWRIRADCDPDIPFRLEMVERGGMREE